MKFYKCDYCGNVVEMIKESGVTMVCCDQEMTEIVPGTSDGAKEKHVPVCENDGNTLVVKVGSEEHPMLEKHFIEWIAVETDRGAYRMTLHPGAVPQAKFVLAEGEKVLNVYAYCNLHGLYQGCK